MQNSWAIPGRMSVVKPASPASGDPTLPPPHPPDPPDPSSNLSPIQFPPLSASPPMSRSELRRALISKPTVDTVMVQADSQSRDVVSSPSTSQIFSSETTSTEIRSQTTVPATGNPNTVSQSDPAETNQTHFKILPPRNSSPILTNRASQPPPTTQTPVEPSPVPPLLPSPSIPTPNQPQNPSLPTTPSPINTQSTPTLAEKLRIKGDKTLSRLAPIQISDTGRPRVLIPDAVFEEGANLHKDFIICYFNGRPPPFLQIQSVLNHMWGKGRKLEIHNNPLQRSTLVRIPSEYLRQKILEKTSGM